MQAAQYNKLAALEGRTTRDIWTGKIKTSDFGLKPPAGTIIVDEAATMNQVIEPDGTIRTTGTFAGNGIGVYDGGR